MRKPRAQRVAIRVAACAVIGAVATVGVAWGCAAFANAQNFLHIQELKGGFGRIELPPRLHNWVPHRWTGFDEVGAPDFVSAGRLSAIGTGFQSDSVKIEVTRSYPTVVRMFELTVVRSGLPWPGLVCWADEATELPGAHDFVWRGGSRAGSLRLPMLEFNQRRPLPWTPLLPGFALDTAFYAGIALTLWSAPTLIRRHLRRARGHCPACNYKLSGLPPGAPCPECAHQPGGRKNQSPAAYAEVNAQPPSRGPAAEGAAPVDSRSWHAGGCERG
jgi:hypothetical protein